MKKITTLAVFALLIAGLQAQTTTTEITIEAITNDSIFIVEKTTSAPTKDNPRGRVIIDYYLKRGWGEVAATIEAVRKSARDKQIESVKTNEAADRIEESAKRAILAAQKKN